MKFWVLGWVLDHKGTNQDQILLVLTTTGMQAKEQDIGYFMHCKNKNVTLTQ